MGKGTEGGNEAKKAKCLMLRRKLRRAAAGGLLCLHVSPLYRRQGDAVGSPRSRTVELWSLNPESPPVVKVPGLNLPAEELRAGRVPLRACSGPGGTN